jgi:hypothetical protein
MKIVLNQYSKRHLLYKSIDISIFIDFFGPTVINKNKMKLKLVKIFILLLDRIWRKYPIGVVYA